MSNDVLSTPLGSMADVHAGYPFRTGIEEITDGAARVVQMRDIDRNGCINWDGVIRTGLTGRKSPDWLVAGDLLLIARGSRYFATALDAVPEPAVCGPHLFQLRLRPAAGLLPEFLAWQINQPPIQRTLRKAAEGSSQLSVRRPELEALPIMVPPLSHQKKIIKLAQLALRERALLTSLIQVRERQLETLASALAGSATPSSD